MGAMNVSGTCCQKNEQGPKDGSTSEGPCLCSLCTSTAWDGSAQPGAAGQNQELCDETEQRRGKKKTKTG